MTDRDARARAEFGGSIARLARDSTPWWPPPVRPPDDAPNIVLVLLDDLGFSDIAPYGAEIHTPTLDRLAERGVRYANYHTAPLCSPARAAILTGLNPHRAGFAGVANFDPGFPGWTMEIDQRVATLPRVLRDAGYATFAVGKWHLTRDAVMHDGGPKSSWPLQQGFDRFYGILEGFTNLHHPHRLVQDNSPVDIDRYPDGYYFTDDITTRAISYIQGLRAHDATRPFFLYLAHAAVHGPLHAKDDDIERYRGRYAAGWDELRRERFARQLELGLFPHGTRLPPANHEPGYDVGPWAELDAEEQRLFSRYMEVYAAMVDNVDQNLGRLLDVLDAMGELDRTIVVFTSDNGATAEGGGRGTRSYFKAFFGAPPSSGWVVDVPRDPSLIGGPQTVTHYPRGWGMASNTPFRLYKSTTHAGGVRVPLIVAWPAGIPSSCSGGVRHQYQYVTDLLPTLLELAGVEDPQDRDGVSFAASLSDEAAPSTHIEQYSECFGNRSFYRDGWKLVALHRRGGPYDDREWQLYDTRVDPTEVDDLAAARPDMVRELSEAWERAAEENQVFPLDDGTGLLTLLRRPDDAGHRRAVTLLPGTPTLERYRSHLMIGFRSFRIDVRLDHRAGDEGMLVAHGDQGGGYAMYVDADGNLQLAYNQYGELFEASAGVLPAGARTVTLDAAARDGFTWDLTVCIDGRVAATLAGMQMLLGFAPFEGIDVGIDRRSPVVWHVYERHGAYPYTGALQSVTYTPGDPAPYDPELMVEAVRKATFERQ